MQGRLPLCLESHPFSCDNAIGLSRYFPERSCRHRCECSCGDVSRASAIFDRLLHYRHPFLTNGKSFRMKNIAQPSSPDGQFPRKIGKVWTELTPGYSQWKERNEKTKKSPADCQWYALCPVRHSGHVFATAAHHSLSAFGSHLLRSQFKAVL